MTTKGRRATAVSAFEFVAAVVIVGGTVLSGPPSRATGQVTSGEWLVHWSAAGAFAIHEREPRCVPIFENSYRSTHRVLSAVGNVVSFTDGSEGPGEIHPVHGRRYASIDLDTREPGEVTRLFDETEVVTALRRDPLVAKHLRGAAPADLEELVSALGTPCEIDFPGLRSAFRVKSIGGATAVVEFGLGGGCESRRETFTTLAIEVPIPADLRELFVDARRSLPRFPDEDSVLEAQHSK